MCGEVMVLENYIEVNYDVDLRKIVWLWLNCVDGVGEMSIGRC